MSLLLFLFIVFGCFGSWDWKNTLARVTQTPMHGSRLLPMHGFHSLLLHGYDGNLFVGAKRPHERAQGCPIHGVRLDRIEWEIGSLR